jgi:hypothetical protein
VFPIGISFDVPSLERDIDRLRNTLDESMREGLAQVGEMVAASARAEHPYQNRTGDLEASTQAVPPIGAFLASTLTGGVVATEEYADFVNDRPGYEFLEPAFERSMTGADIIVQSALDDAVARAGLGR